MTAWLDVPQLAMLADISERKARSAIARAFGDEARLWRGCRLVIRQRRGRGGTSGSYYEVRSDSLPLGLQLRWKALQTPSEASLKIDDKTSRERDWWLEFIQPALVHPKGTRERGAAIRALEGQNVIGPQGKRFQTKRRTIERMIRAFEEQGYAGLYRRKRSDAGQRRTILFRVWDEAVSFDDATKHRIAHELRQYIRGLHKAGESTAVLGVLAADKLKRLTEAAGFAPGQDVLATICTVPENVIKAERTFRKVHTFKADRKAYEDKRPRIARQRTGLAPMDIVVGDIHPVDILCRREDGSVATPRAIAWLDLATNRIWFDLVLLPKGEGVRNAHVIASFANMVNAWGAPRALYLDNGSEYNWSAFIDDALKLIDQGRRTIEHIAPWSERESNVVRARPYNAAAKPIEGIFGLLERHQLASIPGWIGGDRMRKKSANVGREPDPFPGTFEELCSLIQAALHMYHILPQKGSLNGRSPEQVYQQAISDGWGMTAVNPDALRIAFSTEETRIVRQGRVQYDGRAWTCRELQAYQGDRVTLLVPKYERWRRIPVRDEHGQLLGIVEPDQTFAMLDTAGARESAARAAAHRAGLRALDRAAPDVDRLQERSGYLNRLPKTLPAPIAETISYSEQAAEVIAHMNDRAADKQEREQRRIEAHNKRMNDLAAHFRNRRTGDQS